MAGMSKDEGRISDGIEDAGLPEHLLEIGPLFAASRDVDDKRHRTSPRGRREQERYLLHGASVAAQHIVRLALPAF